MAITILFLMTGVWEKLQTTEVRSLTFSKTSALLMIASENLIKFLISHVFPPASFITRLGYFFSYKLQIHCCTELLWVRQACNASTRQSELKSFAIGLHALLCTRMWSIYTGTAVMKAVNKINNI